MGQIGWVDICRHDMSNERSTDSEYVNRFLVMVVFALLGLILSATCNSIETYCAAQVCPSKVNLDISKLTKPTLGLLHHRLHWHDLLHRCHYS